MAVLHQAQLTPSKIEVLRSWTPRQSWFVQDGDVASLEVLGAYRFDDPAGKVGIETHLLACADKTYQVPLTYREAPLEGGESSLIATMQHSVLGKRWVYDALADDVYLQAMVTTIMTGGSQAALEVVTDAGLKEREPTTFVQGSGSPGTTVPRVGNTTRTARGTSTLVTMQGLELTVPHVVAGSGDEASVGQDDMGTGTQLTWDEKNLPSGPISDAVHTLLGSWPGRESPVPLAYLYMT